MRVIFRLDLPGDNAASTEQRIQQPPVLLPPAVRQRRWGALTASVMVHGAGLAAVYVAAAVADPGYVFPRNLRVPATPVILRVSDIRLSDPDLMAKMQLALNAHRALQTAESHAGPAAHSAGRRSASEISGTGLANVRLTHPAGIRMVFVPPPAVRLQTGEQSPVAAVWESLPPPPAPKRLVMPPAGKAPAAPVPVMADGAGPVAAVWENLPPLPVAPKRLVLPPAGKAPAAPVPIMADSAGPVAAVWENLPPLPAAPKRLVMPPAGKAPAAPVPVMADIAGTGVAVAPAASRSAVAQAAPITSSSFPAAPEERPIQIAVLPPRTVSPGAGNRPPRGGLGDIFSLPAIAPLYGSTPAAGPLPVGPARVTAGRRIEHPPDGKFDVVIVQPTLPDNIPDSAGIMAGRPVYTVYLQVGDAKEWVLHYSALDTRTVQNGNIVTLGDPRPVSAPYPRISLLPPSVPPSEEKFLFVHGLLDENGILRELRVLGQHARDSGMLLDALTEWQFRPARRGTDATRLEVLFAIPVRRT